MGFSAKAHDGEVTAEKAAEWYVLLNCWEWPSDLPGKPNPPSGLSVQDERMAIRGAFAALGPFVDLDIVDMIWQDEDRWRSLVSANRAA